MPEATGAVNVYVCPFGHRTVTKNMAEGVAALYHCDPQVTSDSPLAQCRQVAWRLACCGLVALFKMRAENGRLHSVMLKLAPETARKLGSPQHEIKQ